MSLYKRKDSNIWWISIPGKNNKRIRESTGTTIKYEANIYHDKREKEIWREKQLNEKPRKLWEEAVFLFLKKRAYTPSYNCLLKEVKILDKYLKGKYLDEIDNDLIHFIIESRTSDYDRRYKEKKVKVSINTVNTTISRLRAILNYACHDLKWIQEPPRIKSLKVPKRKRFKPVYLTTDDAINILNQLDSHTKPIIEFSFATGLRKSNTINLMWSQIDMDRKALCITSDISKNKKTFTIPLSDWAMNILNSQKGIYSKYVFIDDEQRQKNYKHEPWKKALDQAGIAPYLNSVLKSYPSKDLSEYKYKCVRWHDIRHSWASWHLEAGTPLYILKILGGWKCIDTVLRYAHLSPDYTSTFANKIKPL